MTANTKKVRVGIIGTSWWVDSMYLPALANHQNAELTAICGRNEQRAKARASEWSIKQVFTDIDAFVDCGLDAVIVASGNDTHYDFTMKALNKNLHVLCEKPLSLSYPQAVDMSELAKSKNLKNMTPFTYSYMPSTRYLKELIDNDYIGEPYHLNMRYYTGFGRASDYLWRFDKDKAGSGASGDIGSHFIYIAIMLYGDITGVFAKLGKHIKRAQPDPQGKNYQQSDDNAIMTLQFANGALGSIHVSALANEETPFGQIHQMEFHGSKGSLHSYTDWDKTQQVSGAQAGDGATKPLVIPDHIWNGIRQDTVHNSYKDVFRTQDTMARAFISDIVEDRNCKPDFEDGAKVQKVIEAALKSDTEGRWVELEEG